MVRTANPYRPGFNQAPAVLAGRGEVTDAVTEALEVAAYDARTPRPLMITGSRGVGKTVILGQAREIAASTHSWVSATIEAHPHTSLVPALVAQLHDATNLYTQADPPERQWRLSKTTLKAGIAGVGGAAEFERTTGAPPDGQAQDLAPALRAAMLAALERDAGLLLTVDELHVADRSDVATLAAALQNAVSHDWPLVAILAGLPSLQDPRRAVTYLERAEWHTLGLLTTEDTIHALSEPAQGAGRPMDADAAALLAGASGGYPYAIQVVGHHTWRASHGATTINTAHAKVGIQAAQRDLATGLYTARWNDTTTRERDYLRAMARLTAAGDKSNGGTVARKMGTTTPAISYLRNRLLRKGTIYAEGRNLRFAVPGMAEWINTHPDD